jgi:CoA-transferase family III
MRLLDLAPTGPVSAGGSCRLLPAGGGQWVALNLARRDDVELLAAWMGHDWDGPVWDAVAGALTTWPADAAVERAQLLGLPAAVAAGPPPRRTRGLHPGGPRRRPPRRILDLSALWAGPLCARLLGTARDLAITKVEDPHRPDGARAGPPAFWAHLNAAKDECFVDLTTADGRDELASLVADADVVVTSARARTFAPLGLDPHAYIAGGGIWVAITGYGLFGPWRDRVAFGDDAAVAGGAAVAAGGPDAPVFVLDAVADPLAGLHGAATVLAALDTDRGALVDVAMRDVVADALHDSQYAARTEQEVA